MIKDTKTKHGSQNNQITGFYRVPSFAIIGRDHCLISSSTPYEIVRKAIVFLMILLGIEVK